MFGGKTGKINKRKKDENTEEEGNVRKSKNKKFGIFSGQLGRRNLNTDLGIDFIQNRRINLMNMKIEEQQEQMMKTEEQKLKIEQILMGIEEREEQMMKTKEKTLKIEQMLMKIEEQMLKI